MSTENETRKMFVGQPTRLAKNASPAYLVPHRLWEESNETRAEVGRPRVMVVCRIRGEGQQDWTMKNRDSSELLSTGNGRR